MAIGNALRTFPLGPSVEVLLGRDLCQGCSAWGAAFVEVYSSGCWWTGPLGRDPCKGGGVSSVHCVSPFAALQTRYFPTILRCWVPVLKRQRPASLLPPAAPSPPPLIITVIVIIVIVIINNIIIIVIITIIIIIVNISLIPPILAHPSHGSWPHNEPHRRPQWHRRHASPTPIDPHFGSRACRVPRA